MMWPAGFGMMNGGWYSSWGLFLWLNWILIDVFLVLAIIALIKYINSSKRK